jgi:hypothetical protein
VEAATGLPLRFLDDGMEWTYSYKENTAPIAIPENLKSAMGRVMPKVGL